MFIQRKDFDIPDPDNKEYSFMEIDFYAWIPTSYRKEEENHRLSIRKNLITKKYEVIKYIYETKETIVIKTDRDLQRMLNEARQLWDNYHSKWSGTKKEEDIVI